MKFHCSKITRPGVCLKNMVTFLFLTGKGTWALTSPPPSGVTVAFCSYGKFPGYTSQKGFPCRNLSEHHPSPSAFHPFHEILITNGF